jgi:hypothetical protein
VEKKDWPVLITEQPEFLSADQIDSTDVFQILLKHLGTP